MAAGDLTTLANVRQYLGLTATTDDLLLGRLITAASTWMKSYLNRDILTATYTEVQDGNGESRLIVGNYPVTSITSLAVRNDTAPTLANLVFDQATVTRIDGDYFPEGNSNITITYVAGFAACPFDLEEACIELVAVKYREKDRVGTTSVNAKGESVTFSVMDIPANVKTILQQYKNVVPV